MAPPRHALTILAVQRLPEAAAFYARALEWQQVVDAPVYREFVGPNGQRLGLYERTAFGRNTGQTPAALAPGQLSSTELYFEVDEPEQLCARLEALGARLLSALSPRDWGDEVAYYADADGTVLAVARVRSATYGAPRPEGA